MYQLDDSTRKSLARLLPALERPRSLSPDLWRMLLLGAVARISPDDYAEIEHAIGRHAVEAIDLRAGVRIP